MPLAMEYRSIFPPLVIKAHPQMKAKVSYQTWVLLLLASPLERTAHSNSLFLGPNKPFGLQPRPQLSSLLP